MRKILMSFFLTLMPFMALFSQSNSDQAPNGWKKFLHIEAGYLYPEGLVKESVSIRQNISYYYANQFSGGYISSVTTGSVIGVTYEYFSPGIRGGVSTGLRFTAFHTEISGYSSSNSDFFYLRYSVLDSDTRFARVTSLTETNNLISIPLELKLIPIQYKNMGFFAKAGIEYSIMRFGNGVDITFQDEHMDLYKDVILGSLDGSTNNAYSTFYSSLGITLGKEGKPNYTFEAILPSFFLTKNNFALIGVDSFEGFKLSVQFPVRTNK